MKTIQEAISTIIKTKPYLEESLNEGIINLTALANQLMPEVEKLLSKEVKTGALVMAIKRHYPGKLTQINIQANNLIKNISNIIVRSDISVFTYENTQELPSLLAKLSSELSLHKGLFYTFSQGVFETTVIINNRAEDRLYQILSSVKWLSFTRNLSCITLYLPDDNTEIPGYYYFILKKIAWEGINIVEILSTTNEFSIIVSDDDVDRVFSVLKE